jgi:hypothetical protein
MSERDWQRRDDWAELVTVLRACQGICRQLAEEALMRIGIGAEGLGHEPVGERQTWLVAERKKLERLLEQLGDPL